MAETRFCIWCGHENPLDAEVCEQCGSRLTRATPQEPLPPSMPLGVEAAPSPKEPAPSEGDFEERVTLLPDTDALRSLFPEETVETPSVEIPGQVQEDLEEAVPFSEWLPSTEPERTSEPESAPSEPPAVVPEEEVQVEYGEQEPLPEASTEADFQAWLESLLEGGPSEEAEVPEEPLAFVEEAAEGPGKPRQTEPMEMAESALATQEVPEQEPSPPVLSEAQPLPEPTEEGPSTSLIQGTLLDESEWEHLATTLAQPEAAAPSEAAAEDLEPGELPDWLKALRTQEAQSLTEAPVLEEEGEVPAEVAGPLAGIPDVLPFEPRILQMVEPTRPVLRLVLREEEREWARRFQELLRPKVQKRSPGAERALPYGLWRMGIGLLLVLLLSLMLWLLGNSPAVPQLSFAGTRFLQAVAQMPQGGVVLVAVDYHPAWQAEVGTAALVALRTVEGRTPHYVFMSTVPYGPAQIEALVREVGLPQNRYTVLGYLPGGRAAMALFAQAPRAAFPPPVQGRNPWAQPVLASWRGLSDTAMVLVVTESPAKARDWLEQVGPILPKSTPFTLVTSLQAAAVLEPYLGYPAQGWVAGMPDALALAAMLHHPLGGPARVAPVALGPGLLAGLILAMLSAASLGLLRWIRRRGERA